MIAVLGNGAGGAFHGGRPAEGVIGAARAHAVGPVHAHGEIEQGMVRGALGLGTGRIYAHMPQVERGAAAPVAVPRGTEEKVSTGAGDHFHRGLFPARGGAAGKPVRPGIVGGVQADQGHIAFLHFVVKIDPEPLAHGLASHRHPCPGPAMGQPRDPDLEMGRLVFFPHGVPQAPVAVFVDVHAMRQRAVAGGGDIVHIDHADFLGPGIGHGPYQPCPALVVHIRALRSQPVFHLGGVAVSVIADHFALQHLSGQGLPGGKQQGEKNRHGGLHGGRDVGRGGLHRGPPLSSWLHSVCAGALGRPFCRPPSHAHCPQGSQRGEEVLPRSFQSVQFLESAFPLPSRTSTEYGWDSMLAPRIPPYCSWAYLAVNL